MWRPAFEYWLNRNGRAAAACVKWAEKPGKRPKLAKFGKPGNCMGGRWMLGRTGTVESGAVVAIGEGCWPENHNLID